MGTDSRKPGMTDPKSRQNFNFPLKDAYHSPNSNALPIIVTGTPRRKSAPTM